MNIDRSKKTAVRKPVVIGLVLVHAYSYDREILQGIMRFATTRPHWRFVSFEPEIDARTRNGLKQLDAAIVGINSHEWCDLVMRSGVPIVNVACVVPDLPIPRVGVDNIAIGQLAAQHFVERGIRSFAFAGHAHFAFSIEREASFRAALGPRQPELSVFHVQGSPKYDSAGYLFPLDRKLEGWLSSLPRPSGILTANDRLAVEVTDCCRTLGIRIPEELAVLSVDNDDLYCRIARPELSSVILPSEAIGVRAAAVVDQMVTRRRPMSKDILLPPLGIAVRRSTEFYAIDDPEVVAALRFIRENRDRSLQVRDVVNHVNVGRRSLERRVLSALGVTLGAEMRRVRFDHARRLLAETDLSIAEVARQSGFGGYRQLTDTFRQQLKQSPMRYRRMLRDAIVTSEL